MRRELADNFCYYQPHYDSLQGAWEWARKTLMDHAADKREHIYTYVNSPLFLDLLIFTHCGLKAFHVFEKLSLPLCFCMLSCLTFCFSGRSSWRKQKLLIL